MNAKYKEKWIEALKSGKYEQGQYALKKNTPKGIIWCCLGVLGDIIAKDLGLEWEVDKITGNYALDHGSSILSTKLEEESGLSSDEVNDLLELNDDKFKSFKFIASYIKRKIK